MPQTTKRSRRAAPAPVIASTNGHVDHVSRVYNEVRELIVGGELAPGVRIAERAVAERLGLSRTPVRSALHRLQQEGFVASAGRGKDQRLIVAPLTEDDGREVLLLAGHLEGLAAHTAANLPRERRARLVTRLRAINQQLAVESRKRASVRVFDLDMEFHRTYVDHVAGRRVVALHRAIKAQAERYVRLYVSVLLDQLPKSVKEHDRIIRAIARGDARGAQRAVETNWHNAADRLGRIISQHGERGVWQAWTVVPSPKG